MSNLMDIQSQIEKLQKQANDIKAKEFDKTIEEIVAKMQAFGITQKDLQAAMARGGKSRAGAKSPAKVRQDKGRAGKTGTVTVAAKYRGPNGESWSGRGLTPRWLASLLAQGKQKEEFVIKT